MKTVIISTLLTFVIFFSCKKEPEAPRPSKRQIIDLTHEFSEETVYWVTAKEFEMDVVAEGHTDHGYYYAANNFTTAEHGGTHIDAPIHFAANKQYVNEIPLEKLIGSAIKVDVSELALENPDYLIRIEDFTNWEKKNSMQIPDGSIVLLETGFSKYYPDKKKYLGTDKRGPEAVKLLHFPGLSPEAAKWLVENRNINSIGLDTPSIDYGQSNFFKAHVILLSENIPAFENLTNLDKLPSKGFDVVALPMKIKGGSGAPLRIVAFVND
ncbi:cyclase family protein [Seonamhaeicola maritimus]|uniref:Cyclase family protein n=1 Tax=Seonamhaeicola maritimus TaxID=2591822 RepID=A0A5C7GHH8_9FLAO|nr:cyclase family protein [Seonamhaeicola maritimus]TXG37048.1 cyclase family protein [Seonamhaeicola maritimus]